MKTKLNLVVFTLALLVFALSCKKAEETPAPAEVKITAQQNGQPVTLARGQTLNVTLQNPGDGLYSFDQPKYDATVLRFVDHLHQGPTNNNAGNFGIDSWDFVAIKAGSTALTITATRNNDNSTTATMLSNSVSVK
jgi:predicted secreted protein